MGYIKEIPQKKLEKEKLSDKMKVSIITTCYNRVKTIKDAIESVKAQTYEDIEYIIVDGASTDGSVEVIKTAIAQGFNNSGG